MNQNIPEDKFIPGLELCQAFYIEAVEPVVRQAYPNLLYSAALIGDGSEVLGYDNCISTDHHWGPRVMLFLNEPDVTIYKEPLIKILSEKLPRRFRDYPTSYIASEAKDDIEHNIQMFDFKDEGPVNHRVEIQSLKHFFKQYLGFDIENEISVLDWLTFPQQKLLSVTQGKVFHDEIGLEDLRRRFSFYQHDVWLYLLACTWKRIEQEEHLMARAGSVGDEIGSALIASRLVKDLMHLCFLMEKKYAPYPKWFGTAFRRLESGAFLESTLMQVLTASNWLEREKFLVEAYEYVAKLHDKQALTKPLFMGASNFHDRPYKVISMGKYSCALTEKISDPDLKELLKKPLIGSIDLFSDNTDLLSNPVWRPGLYGLLNSSV